MNTEIKESRYLPGEVIVHREIWAGKIWTARPMIVVRDDAEIIALHIPVNTVWKHHYGINGDKVTTVERKDKSWVLKDTVWTSSASYIKLTIPDESYSVLLFKNAADNGLSHWYVNLEDPEAPMHRTRIGFDCTDQILDMVIDPGLKDWHWEDEDELQEAVEAGLISNDKAMLLYSKGEQVRDLIMSGNSIFNAWESWHPNYSWKVPGLPQGWDAL